MSEREMNPNGTDRDRLLERMSDRYIALDDEWRVAECNSGGHEALVAGLEGEPAAAELIGRDLWSLLPGGEDSTIGEEFRRVAVDGAPATFEAEFEALSGWFEFRAFPNPDGLSVLFTSMAREDERERTIARRTDVINELYEVFHDDSAAFESKVESLLGVGRRALGTEFGSLSRVDGDDYVFEFVDDDDCSLEAGAEVDLSWTSCEVVVASEERLVLSDMVTEAPDVAERDGNQELGLSCYIGAPVEVDGDVYGTLCFYDREPKSEPFSEWEAGLIDFMGLLVSYELQRRRSEAQLRSRNEQLEEFRGVLSHDLRNPVTVARGYVDVARETGDDEALDRIREALDRMDAIINEVSDIAALDDEPLEPDSVEIAAVARDARGMVRART